MHCPGLYQAMPTSCSSYFYRVHSELDFNGCLTNAELIDEGDNVCRCMLRLESVPFNKQKMCKKRMLMLLHQEMLSWK